MPILSRNIYEDVAPAYVVSVLHTYGIAKLFYLKKELRRLQSTMKQNLHHIKKENFGWANIFLISELQKMLFKFEKHKNKN